MLRDSLERAVRSAQIGSNSVLNLISYIGGVHITGGILKYTSDMGFRYINNIQHNGDDARVYDEDVLKGDFYKLESDDDTVTVSTSDLVTSDRGDIYNHPIYTTPREKFLSPDAFYDGEGIFREDNLNNNSPITNRTGLPYSKLYTDATHWKRPNEIHKPYELNGLNKVRDDKHRQYSLINKERKNVVTEKFDRYSDRFTYCGLYNDDDTITINSAYYDTAIENKMFNPLSFTGRTFDDAFDGGSKYDFETYGIVRYYTNERDKYKSPLRGIKTPWGKPYSVDNSYGFHVGGEDEVYSIGNGIYTIKRDKKFNNGAFRYHHRLGEVDLNEYYEEVTGRIEKSDTADHSVAITMTKPTGDVSNIIRKTNSLFKGGDIDTLVNRFHTKSGVECEQPELVTAYDYGFGMSRGRNLLRKEFEGQMSGDKSSGYDNPYCRVWTAHHQYSKLKDRIRPFMDGDEFKTLYMTQKEIRGRLREWSDDEGESGSYRLGIYGTLRNNGFVKITPMRLDETNGNSAPKEETIQNYMFSIENLAWRDCAGQLSEEQRGKSGGRIMWFPPYNLKFTENVSARWESNEFIGRGEPIYTYSQTERTGTLNFTLLIDHPSILNTWRNTDEPENKDELERDILRYFAGCGDLSERIKSFKTPKDDVDEPEEEEEGGSKELQPVEQLEKVVYVMFFSNDFTSYDFYNSKDRDVKGAIDELKKYEWTTVSADSYTKRDTVHKEDKEILRSYNNDNYSKYALNTTPMDYAEEIETIFFGRYDDSIELRSFEDLLNLPKEFADGKVFGHDARTCEVSNIEIRGFASSHGYLINNESLAKRRRDCIKNIITSMDVIDTTKEGIFTEEEGRVVTVSGYDVNELRPKISRAAYAIFNLKWKDTTPSEDTNVGDDITETYEGEWLDWDENAVGNVDEVAEEENNGPTSDDLLKTLLSYEEVEEYDERYTYDNEYLYFSNLMDVEGPLVYKNIVDKVKFFDPAFHSITPEGFNARLTFLHQCTRQGPTNPISAADEDSAAMLRYGGNLSFGRAPYCILRIGDFFNTKICIDSLSIDYAADNGIQWDLNPEGAGVQPMYANVTINFKFIGGQDISGPIERLQNAVTSNFYANTSIFSRHADTENTYFDVHQNPGPESRISKRMADNNQQNEEEK